MSSLSGMPLMTMHDIWHCRADERARPEFFYTYILQLEDDGSLFSRGHPQGPLTLADAYINLRGQSRQSAGAGRCSFATDVLGCKAGQLKRP